MRMFDVPCELSLKNQAGSPSSSGGSSSTAAHGDTHPKQFDIYEGGTSQTGACVPALYLALC
jgi:hypothetical protein